MVVFFFKQKTAYEMRISDWSSDVCSSDLPSGHYAAAELPQYEHDPALARRLLAQAGHERSRLVYKTSTDPLRLRIATAIQAQQIGRASCRESVCQYV